MLFAKAAKATPRIPTCSISGCSLMYFKMIRTAWSDLIPAGSTRHPSHESFICKPPTNPSAHPAHHETFMMSSLLERSPKSKPLFSRIEHLRRKSFAVRGCAEVFSSARTQGETTRNSSTAAHKFFKASPELSGHWWTFIKATVTAFFFTSDERLETPADLARCIQTLVHNLDI
jgi:hypothetical protein